MYGQLMASVPRRVQHAGLHKVAIGAYNLGRRQDGVAAADPAGGQDGGARMAQGQSPRASVSRMADQRRYGTGAAAGG
jgi:hypothetical protein